MIHCIHFVTHVSQSGVDLKKNSKSSQCLKNLIVNAPRALKINIDLSKLTCRINFIGIKLPSYSSKAYSIVAPLSLEVQWG